MKFFKQTISVIYDNNYCNIKEKIFNYFTVSNITISEKRFRKSKNAK